MGVEKQIASVSMHDNQVSRLGCVVQVGMVPRTPHTKRTRNHVLTLVTFLFCPSGCKPCTPCKKFHTFILLVQYCNQSDNWFKKSKPSSVTTMPITMEHCVLSHYLLLCLVQRQLSRTAWQRFPVPGPIYFW